MATTKMTRQWNRWAGTVQDLERATRIAIDVLAQRSRTEPPCQIEIALPQRVMNAESPDALQTEIDTRDLDLIRSIRIEVGAKRGRLRQTISRTTVERTSAVAAVSRAVAPSMAFLRLSNRPGLTPFRCAPIGTSCPGIQIGSESAHTIYYSLPAHCHFWEPGTRITLARQGLQVGFIRGTCLCLPCLLYDCYNAGRS
jgi:hypothetical protein